MIERIAYGKIADMVAEVSALEMSEDWLRDHGFRYAVMPVGDAQYDTEFCRTLREARDVARSCARENGKVPVQAV